MQKMERHLSSSTLNALRCKICNNYLSVPPIISASDQHFCGRCKAIGSRATAYETLAKEALFPCKNDKNGCKEQLSFGKTMEHEGKCDYAAMLCPSLNCVKEIMKKTVVQHFQKDHEDLLLEGDSFTIPKSWDFFESRGMVVGDDLYLIRICLLHCRRMFSLSLLTIFEGKEVFYDLEITSKNGNKIVKKEQKAISMFEYKTDEQSKFNHEGIESVLGSPDYTFSFKILGNEEKSVDQSLLEEFECIVCKEYMKPPIYLCKTGHSLCGRCKVKIARCPSCQLPFEGARNFSLESLSEHVGYSPKRSSMKTAKQQKVQPARKVVQCPLVLKKRCKWRGALCDISKHAHENHPRYCRMELSKTYFRNISKVEGPMDCQILNFNRNTFMLSMECVPGSHICCKVEHIELNPGDQPKYRFVLEFVDQNNSGKMLVFDHMCLSLDRVYDCTDNSLLLDIDMLQPFISSEARLYFVIRVNLIDHQVL